MRSLRQGVSSPCVTHGAQETAVLTWSVECSLCCWGGLVYCSVILIEIHVASRGCGRKIGYYSFSSALK